MSYNWLPGVGESWLLLRLVENPLILSGSLTYGYPWPARKLLKSGEPIRTVDNGSLGTLRDYRLETWCGLAKGLSIRAPRLI